VPEHIRSDNGAEMTAKVVRNWLATLGARTLYIEPGSRSTRNRRTHW
jgi:putative transposase